MTKRLLAAAVVIVATLALLPTAAGAAGETIGSCIVEKFNEEGGAENVEQIIEAGEADDATDEQEDALEELESRLEDCVDAPNPILPETSEIIWGTLAFAVLVGLMWWKLFPAVRKAMDARAQRIQDDLDAAERAKVTADELVRQHEAELAGAKSEAAEMLEQARAEMEDFRSRRRSEIDAEIGSLREQAVADVEASKQQALGELQSEVSQIALGAAESVIGRELADRSTQIQLIEDYINRVGRGEATAGE